MKSLLLTATLVQSECAPIPGQMVLRMELSQLGSGSGLACAVPCSVINGIACNFAPGWACILQYQSPSKTPYCAQSCSSDSDCYGGNTCNMGAKSLTMNSHGICMSANDAVGMTKAVIMSVAEQQKFAPMKTASGMTPKTQFAFLTKNLADLMNQVSNQHSLASDPAMMELRVTLAALIKLHPEARSNSIQLDDDIQSYVEYGIDESLHAILHPLSSIREGSRGAMWDLKHPLRSRTMFNWLRGLLIFGLLYTLAGCYYNAAYLNMNGLDRIPHVSFWLDYPFLVLDGFNFAVMTLIGAGSSGFSFLASSRDSKYASVRDSFANFEPIN